MASHRCEEAVALASLNERGILYSQAQIYPDESEAILALDMISYVMTVAVTNPYNFGPVRPAIVFLIDTRTPGNVINEHYSRRANLEPSSSSRYYI